MIFVCPRVLTRLKTSRRGARGVNEATDKVCQKPNQTIFSHHDCSVGRLLLSAYALLVSRRRQDGRHSIRSAQRSARPPAQGQGRRAPRGLPSERHSDLHRDDLARVLCSAVPVGCGAQGCTAPGTEARKGPKNLRICGGATGPRSRLACDQVQTYHRIQVQSVQL